MSKRKTDLAEKVTRYLRAKEAGKRGYERADRILKEIAQEIKPGEQIELTLTGKKATLRDRFDGKDLVWQPCAARRWEIEIQEP